MSVTGSQSVRSVARRWGLRRQVLDYHLARALAGSLDLQGANHDDVPVGDRDRAPELVPPPWWGEVCVGPVSVSVDGAVTSAEKLPKSSTAPPHPLPVVGTRARAPISAAESEWAREVEQLGALRVDFLSGMRVSLARMSLTRAKYKRTKHERTKRELVKQARAQRGARRELQQHERRGPGRLRDNLRKTLCCLFVRPATTRAADSRTRESAPFSHFTPCEAGRST
jgi:hypothetical protein